MNGTNCQMIGLMLVVCVNMFKNRIDIFDKGGLHIDEKIVGL